MARVMVHIKSILSILGYLVVVIILGTAIMFVPEATLLLAICVALTYKTVRKREVPHQNQANTGPTRKRGNEGDDVTCSICLEPVGFSEGEDDTDAVQLNKDTTVDLPCGHYFHAGCLKNWAEQDFLCQVFRIFTLHNRHCPNCRRRIPDDVIAYLDDLDIHAQTTKKKSE